MSVTWLSQALLLVLAFSFSVPFMWPRHTMPIPSFYSEALAALLLLSAAFLAICLASKDNARQAPRRIPYVALIFLPLIVVLCLQLAMGKLTFAYNALFPIMVIAVAIGATVLGASCARWYGHEKLLAWICIALVIGGCWNVAAQIVQLTKSWEFATLFSYSKGSLYGNLAQRNHLATYLCWALIATLYLFAKQRLNRYGTIALLLVFLSGLVLTASRMSWVQIVWTAGAGAYLISRMDVNLRPRYWRAILGLPLALLAVTVILPHAVDLLQLSFSRTAIDRLQAEGLDRNRWLIYSQAWEIFKAHPWLGIGPGELQFNQFLLMDHYQAVLFASSAHNLLLDLLVMTGVVGAAGFAWFGIGWFLRIRRTAVSLETAAILLMLAALGIHSLLEFPEWYGFFLFPTAFLIGSLETRFLVFKASLASRTAPLIAVLYSLGCCAVLWYQYKQIETFYQNHYQKNPEAKPAPVELLAELYAIHEKSFFEGPSVFVLNWNISLDPSAVEKKLAFSEKAVRYQPQANVIYRHIVLLCIAGKTAEAKFYVVRVKNSFPIEYQDIVDKLVAASEKYPNLFRDVATEAIRLH